MTYLTLDELTAYIKISRAKLYQMSQAGKIPASKIGRQWRFNQDEIDTWMKNQQPNNLNEEDDIVASSIVVA